MKLELFRSIYTETSTIGRLFIDGEYFGFTLEDAVRPPNIKIQGKTAIPEGTYQVKLTMSNRFKKILPEVLCVPNFQGIRFHGGNTSADTEGCILIAMHMVNENTVQGTLAEILVSALTGEEHAYLTITNIGNV